MHKKTDDDGGRKLTAIEIIKAGHDATRRKILNGDEDEIPWRGDILPQQVGLTPVWADREGKLWVMETTEKGQILKRIWHIT